jgi:hypothetical protein
MELYTLKRTKLTMELDPDGQRMRGQVIYTLAHRDDELVDKVVA